MVDKPQELSSKDFPEKSLGHRFPNFALFRDELRSRLGGVILKVVVKVSDDGKNYMDLAKSGEGLTSVSSQFGLGILWEFVARNFYYKYRGREYVGEQRDFVDEFMTELSFVVAEIRRKEHVWSQLCLNLEKWTKSDTTTTQKTTGSDKGGKTTSGDASKYQVMSKELTQKTDQYGKVSTFDQKSDTTITTHKGVNYAPLGRILGSLNNLQVDFSSFYSRFEHFWNHYSAPTLEWVIDKTTGRRKWVTEEEYEELMEPEPEKRKKKKLGGDAFLILEEYRDTRNWEKYLEALTLYHQQNEKELSTLTETSNRKPRVAKRVEFGEGLLKAYEKFKPFPTVETFRKRVAGTVEIIPEKTKMVDGKEVKIPEQKIVYEKIVGYEDIIEIVASYLDRWELMEEVKPHKISPPKQLMLALLGQPGLGKTYIAGQLAKALGRGYASVSLNGVKDAFVVYGTDMSNPGANPGEVVKAISRTKDQTCLFLWDEIEKSGPDAKMAIGIPTDKSQNWFFKDIFYDFPSPCNNVIHFAALNYPEDLPDFVGDRFRKVNVKPLPYRQRIEVARGFLKKEIIDLEGVWMKYLGRTAQQIFDLFNREDLIKKTLTWTFSIRGTEKNITGSLIPTLLSYVRSQKTLPTDLINHDWKFAPRSDTEEIDRGHKERRREACPYSQDKNLPHRKATDKVKEGYVPQKCVCFINNLSQVPGWKENMGDRDDLS